MAPQTASGLGKEPAVQRKTGLNFAGQWKARLLLGIATLPLGSLFAQIPEPRLTVLSPPGGRQGETLPVVVSGVELEQPALKFSHPGISATPDARDSKKFEVTIAANVPPGFYDARILNKSGVSNPRRFEVSTLPEVEGSPKALTREDAQALALPCVVRGAAVKQQLQWFSIDARRGAEIVLECHATVLDSRLEPLLALFDADGHELARSRNRPLRWTPTADGKLWFSLGDFISNGGAEHFYRLYAGAPAQLPASAPENPLVFWPAPAGAAKETEPNDPANPAVISLPAEIEGEFYPVRDADAFQFAAKKGDVWWMEVTSNRLGLPTNPRLVVERLGDPKGTAPKPADAVVFEDAPWFPGDPDFDGQHFDPIGRFEAKEDGNYKVTVRDLNNTTTPDHSRRYSLSIRKPSPDFALLCAVMPPTPNKAFKTFSGPLVSVRAANLRPGQVLPLRVLAVRRDGFEGVIGLTATELPPGVTAEPCFLGTNQTEGILLLRASSEAKGWTGAIKVGGEALIDGQSRAHPARMSSPLWESAASEFIEPPRSRIVDEITVCVVEDVPFANALKSEPAAVQALASEKVKLTLLREGPSTDAAISAIKPLGVANIDKAKGIDIPSKEGKAEYELDLAPLKLVPGDYNLWFRGEQKVKRDVKGKPTDVTLVLCSTPVHLTIKEAPKK